MTKILPVALVALALPLVGCAQFNAAKTAVSVASGFTITQDTVDKAMASYDAAFLAPATTYRHLYDTNPCPAGTSVSASIKTVCAKREIVVRLQNIAKPVDDALKETQADLNACKAGGADTCAGVSAAYNTLKTAISAAEQVAKNLGVTA